jgi:hypothetical protein
MCLCVYIYYAFLLLHFICLDALLLLYNLVCFTPTLLVYLYPFHVYIIYTLFLLHNILRVFLLYECTIYSWFTPAYIYIYIYKYVCMYVCMYD